MPDTWFACLGVRSLRTWRRLLFSVMSGTLVAILLYMTKKIEREVAVRKIMAEELRSARVAARRFNRRFSDWQRWTQVRLTELRKLARLLK